MNKINIAELLKDCPKGMELDCTMFENVTFEGIKQGEYPIIVKIKEPSMTLSLTKTGGWNLYNSAKCVIFPKGKTTWEGFQRPFKDGEMLISGIGDCGSPHFDNIPFIFKQINGRGNAQCYCAVDSYKGLILNSDDWTPIKGCRHATEEEKAKLFQAIKDNGYKWNAETKTLEKVVEPKFKVGDIIKSVYEEDYRYIITHVTDTHYAMKEVEKGFLDVKPFCEEKNLELIPNKFDITNLKPFDKVLVRDTNGQVWTADLFSHIIDTNPNLRTTFVCIGHYPNQCIPYEENKHLLGTADDCEEFYKTWE